MDELLRLVGSGSLEGSKLICCHKDWIDVAELAKELSSNLNQTKIKQGTISDME